MDSPQRFENFPSECSSCIADDVPGVWLGDNQRRSTVEAISRCVTDRVEPHH